MELMIVIVILAVMASVATVAIPARPSRRNDTAAQIAAARSSALSTGRPVNVLVQLASGAHIVTALPDGTVLADGSVRVHRLTGLVDRQDTTSARRPAPSAP